MPGDFDRANLVAALSRTPDRYLVIVRYRPGHDIDREWVYNDADIDGAKIVWARDMGAETDALVQYFRDRKAVVAEPDVNPSVTFPYETGRK